MTALSSHPPGLPVLAAAVLAGLLGAMRPAAAACLSEAEVADLVASYMDKEASPNPESLSSADAECTRARVNRLLEQALGRPVGYKVALTNPTAQKRFGVAAPVWGQLYAPMLLEDGSVLDAAFGARPLVEADLLVRVSDPRINQARSPQEVLESIDRVIPFIELGDMVVESPSRLDGPALAAINAGARLGVTGVPLPVARGGADLANALRDMQVVIAGDGVELDRGKGSDVMEHPLNAVVWLVQELAREGRVLKKGDLVSLGAFSRLLPPKPGQTLEVRYEGLPGAPSVSVSFK